MVVQQIDGREVVYLAAREAGFAPEDSNIHGLGDAVAFQPLWVLAPVRGLSVRREVKIGVVELVDGDAGRQMPIAASWRCHFVSRDRGGAAVPGGHEPWLDDIEACSQSISGFLAGKATPRAREPARQ
jgi:hypothetical protein